MDFSLWLLFLVTETALILLPGPAVVLVFSHGLSCGFRPSLAANTGILTGNGLYFALSATGLGALVIASHGLFLVIKWAGAAYLIWIGITTFLSTSGPLKSRPAARQPFGATFRTGLVLQLANPKNLIFFMAILPQFIDLNENVALQVLILGATSMIVEFLILMAYGAIGGHMNAYVNSPRLSVWANRFAGSLLIAIGASLTFVRRAAP